MEQKHYPRDPQRDQIHTGRVRVQLINEEGVLQRLSPEQQVFAYTHYVGGHVFMGGDSHCM